MGSGYKNAVTNNEKLFPLFEKKLSSTNPETFSLTANKLGKWLGSERAYYHAARPKIVGLLDVAYVNFRKLEENASKSIAPIFAELISVIIPYLHLFTEPELKERLLTLIRHTPGITPLAETAVLSSGSLPPSIPVDRPASDHQHDPTPRAAMTQLAENRAPDAFSSLMALDLDWFQTRERKGAAQTEAKTLTKVSVQPRAPTSEMPSANHKDPPPTTENVEITHNERSASGITSPLPSKGGGEDLIIEHNPPCDQNTSNIEVAVNLPSPPDFQKLPVEDDPGLHTVAPGLENLGQASLTTDQNEDATALENYQSFIVDPGPKHDRVKETRAVNNVPSQPVSMAGPNIGDRLIVLYHAQTPCYPGCVTITFEVEESFLPSISNWVDDKYSAIGDRTSSLCVSLACYHIAELEEVADRMSERPVCVESLLSMCNPFWPDESMSLRICHNGVDLHLPLSPPLVVTPDQFIDISRFVREGKNKLDIVRHRNVVDCIYVVQMHHPTLRQIKALITRHEQDESWKHFLAEVQRPIEVMTPWDRYKTAKSR